MILQFKPKQLSKSILFTFLFIICFSTVNAQINVLWEARYTSAGLNTDRGNELAIDTNGNVYVTGNSYTNTSNGFDIVTIKYDALGNQKWATFFNGAGSGLDEGRDIAVDNNGNVYVTGYTLSSGSNTNYITIKYDSLGAQQWATEYNGTGNGYDEAYALAIDTLGNVYVTGGSDAGSQGSNYVTVKYNSSGVQQWATSYNGPGNSLDAATQIKLDAQLNVYVSGRSTGSGTNLDIATIKYNNSGSQQWASRYNGILSYFEDAEALYIDNLNNVYVAGSSYGGLATLNDFVTIKYNSSGAQQWAIKYDGPLNDEDKAFDVVVDQNQNVYVAGRSMGTGGTAQNMVTIKYDGLGNLIWLDTYDGPASGYDDAQQMRLGNSGTLYVTGYSAGNGTNNDYLTLKYDTSNGNILWKARFDGPASNSDQAFAMEIDANESIYVTGASQDPVSGQDFSTIKWCQLTTLAGNDAQICIGDSVQLNATSSNGNNFVWTPTTGLSNSSIANPSAFPSSTTTYYVSSSNALGCLDYDTITVTVNPLPSNTITANGSVTFCAGDSVTLSADTSDSYSWSPSGDTTQSITVFNSGNYVLNVIDSNSCSNTNQLSVVVNSLPNVSAGSDATVCNGSSLQINATGALNYLWNTQVTLSDSTIANPLVNPTTPTNYWVIGEDTNGCKKADTVLVAVSVAPTAVMSNSTTNDSLNLNLPNGGDIQFFSTLSTNVISYNWDFGDLIGTSTSANPIYTYTTIGLFKVWLVVTNGQCVDSATVNITVINPIGIAENSALNNVTVFPNPAKDYLTVKMSHLPSGNMLVSVLNSVGQKVKEFTVKDYQKSSFNVDLNDLGAGLYFLQLKVNDTLIVKRFTKTE